MHVGYTHCFLIVMRSVCSTNHTIDGGVPLQWSSFFQSLLWCTILLSFLDCACFNGTHLSTVPVHQTMPILDIRLNRDASAVFYFIVNRRIDGNLVPLNIEYINLICSFVWAFSVLSSRENLSIESSENLGRNECEVHTEYFLVTNLIQRSKKRLRMKTSQGSI